MAITYSDVVFQREQREIFNHTFLSGEIMFS